VSRAKQSYHLPVPIVLKSGSLNLLEHSGPVETCNRIAVPLCVCVFLTVVNLLVCILQHQGMHRVKNTVGVQSSVPEQDA